MSEDNVGATVYTYWQYFFYRGLFHNVTTKGEWESKKVSTEVDDNGKEIKTKHWTDYRKMTLVDHFGFTDFF